MLTKNKKIFETLFFFYLLNSSISSIVEITGEKRTKTAKTYIFNIP
jgi:hypothetical protein